MSATTADFPTGKISQREEPITKKLHPRQNSDEHHGEPMTKQELADIADLRDMVHNISGSVMLLTKLSNQTAAVQPANGNGPGAWGRTFITIAVVFLGWVFTALYIAKTTEGEIRVSNAVLTEQLRETRENFIEYRKVTEMKLALSDERYRQISISLESHGFKMPVQ